MQLVAIDPGLTTGLVYANIKTEKVSLYPMQKDWSPLGLWRELIANDPSLVICEDFEIRPTTPVGVLLASAHRIGIVMAYCEQEPVSELRMQKAAYGKGGYFKGIEKIEEKGAYLKALPHAMDAMRHFLQWYFFGPGYQYNKGQPLELVR